MEKTLWGQRVENTEDCGLCSLREGNIFHSKYISLAYLMLTTQKSYRQLKVSKVMLLKRAMHMYLCISKRNNECRYELFFSTFPNFCLGRSSHRKQRLGVWHLLRWRWPQVDATWKTSSSVSVSSCSVCIFFPSFPYPLSLLHPENPKDFMTVNLSGGYSSVQSTYPGGQSPGCGPRYHRKTVGQLFGPMWI